MSDIQPNIIIEFNRYVHKVRVYKAMVTIFKVQEEATESGEVVRQPKEIYCFTEFYKGAGCSSMSRQVAIRAAEWLLGNGYSGLVALKGNSADSMNRLAGTGITKYKTEDSELYLSPYRSWIDEQNALGGECVSYKGLPLGKELSTDKEAAFIEG